MEGAGRSEARAEGLEEDEDDLEPEAAAVRRGYMNLNPEGRNQYIGRPNKNEEGLHTLLRDYHRRTTNLNIVSKFLQVEHGITYGARSIRRLWKSLGLAAAGVTDGRLTDNIKQQLVLGEMEMDPSKRAGPRTVRERIKLKTGIYLKRDYISTVMHNVDPGGFRLRQPTSRVIRRSALTSRGPHDEWSADGHDKLVKYGIGIWGIRDKFSGKWLGLWVLPNNRLGRTVAYCSVLVICYP